MTCHSANTVPWLVRVPTQLFSFNQENKFYQHKTTSRNPSNPKVASRLKRPAHNSSTITTFIHKRTYRHCVATLTGHGTVLGIGTLTSHGTVLALSQVTSLYWHSYRSRHCIGTLTGHGTVLTLSQVTALYWHCHKSRHCIDTLSLTSRNTVKVIRYEWVCFFFLLRSLR